MHTSTVLWALQTFSFWNTGNWAVTSLLFSTRFREERGPRCRMWKGHYFLQLLGSSLRVLITDGKCLKNCMLPRIGICLDLSPALSQDGSNSLHEVTYIHRGSGLPCPTWWGLLSQSHSQVHSSLHLEDILPCLLTAKENSVLHTCFCPTPLGLSHCISPLTLFPLTLLDHQTSEHTGRVPPAHSGVCDLHYLCCLSWKIKVCSQVETNWSNSTRGPTITSLEQDRPWWRRGS